MEEEEEEEEEEKEKEKKEKEAQSNHRDRKLFSTAKNRAFSHHSFTSPLLPPPAAHLTPLGHPPLTIFISISISPLLSRVPSLHSILDGTTEV